MPFEVALFGHLASLVLGFGAVLAVDWVARLWICRQRSLGDIVRSADNARYPVWLGYAGLVGTGGNDPARKTGQGDGSRPGRRLLLTAVGSASVSQVGWWGAMSVGFLKGH